MKTVAIFAACTLLVLGVNILRDLVFAKQQITAVDLDYGSVSYPVEEGEKFETDKYEGADLFGRLNWKFAHQVGWTASMKANLSMALGQQTVETYKNYSHGILVSADITTGFVNGASQFCYVKDANDGSMGRVSWRHPSEKAPYHGLDTKWLDTPPARTMTIRDFKTQNGLPAYELSVYVIRPETILSYELAEDSVASKSSVSSKLVENPDHTWTVTYQLNPKVWDSEDGTYTEGAPSYYGNQMKFSSGGMMKKAPEFNSIQISFTFNEDWEVLSSDVAESYTAIYGVPVQCKYTSHAEYRYDANNPTPPEYEEYFHKYIDTLTPDDGTGDKLTATDCLMSFATGLLGKEASLGIECSVGEIDVNGVIYLDTREFDLESLDFANFDIIGMLDQIGLRARIGESIRLWFEEGNAYINYGGIHGKIGVGEFLGAISGVPATMDSEGESVDLLSAITEGKFSYGDGKAALQCDLPLFGTTVPLEFHFLLDDENEAVLDYISLDMTVSETPISLRISNSEEILPALAEEERDEYISLLPYIGNLYDLISQQVLHAEINYTFGEYGVTGFVDFDTHNLSAKGEITLVSITEANFEKTLCFVYHDGVAYADLDGIKVKIAVQPVVAFLSRFISLPETSLKIDVGELVQTILSSEFADGLLAKETDGKLTLTMRSTEFLSNLGMQLDSVSFGVQEGEISLSADSLEVCVATGEPFEFSDSDYADYVDLVGYCENIYELYANNEYFEITVSYKDYISGTVAVEKNTWNVAANLTVSYEGIEKQVEAYYVGGEIYVELEGVKVKASVEELIGMISEYLPATEAMPTLESVLELIKTNSLESLVTLTEEKDILRLIVHASELSELLGVDLGEVELKVTAGEITVRALGAELVVRAGRAFEADTEGYVEILPMVQTVIKLIQGDYLHIGAAYEMNGFRFALEGNVDLKIGTMSAIVDIVRGNDQSMRRTIRLYYTDAKFYVDLGGKLKLTASLEEVLALVSEYAGLDFNSLDGNVNYQEVLLPLLSLNFGDYFKLSQVENSVELLVKGTELLQELKVNFELGDVHVGIFEERVELNALGVSLELECGTQPDSPLIEQFVPVADLVSPLVEMFKNGNLAAEIVYNSPENNLAVNGTLNLDIKSFVATMSLTVTCNEAKKNAEITYCNGNIYLSLLPDDEVAQPIRIRAGALEAVKILKEFIHLDDITIDMLLDALFTIDFEALFPQFERAQECSESAAALNLALSIDAFLKELDMNFTLGSDLLLTISTEGKIYADMFGGAVTATIHSGVETPYSTEGYLDIMPYAWQMVEIYRHIERGGNLLANISYKAGGLTVDGTLLLQVSPLTATAQLNLLYQNINKTIGLVYAMSADKTENLLYLTVDGVKLKLDVVETYHVIMSILPKSAQDDEAAKGLLEKILSLDFAKLITLSEQFPEEGTEGENVLKISVLGTELLSSFGMNFNLGEATITLSGGKIGVSVLGAALGVSMTDEAMGEFDGTNFYDLMPLIRKVPDLWEAKAIGLTGDVVLKMGNTELGIVLSEGSALSWADGLKIYLRAELVIGDTVAPMQVGLDIDVNNLNESTVRIAYGEIGMNFKFGEFKSLGDELIRVYNRVYNTVNGILENDEHNPMPQIKEFADVLNLIKGSGTAMLAASEFDWTSLVQELTLTNSAQDGVLLSIVWGALKAVVSELPEASDLVQLGVSYETESLVLRGDFDVTVAHFNESEPFPQLPPEKTESVAGVHYLVPSDFVDFIDYLGAGIGILAEENVYLSVDGTVSTTQTDLYPSGVKYNVHAEVDYQAGISEDNTTPFHLDIDGKNFWIDAETYLMLSLQFKSSDQNVADLYLDFVILDADTNGAQDGMLDFYVTVSKFQEGDGSYSPLRLHATAEDIMTILSGALVAIGGTDVPIINDYIISKWIDPIGESVGELRALGASLLPRLGLGGLSLGNLDIKTLLGSLFGSAPTAQTAPTANKTVRYYIKDITNTNSEGKNTFVIELNGEALYDGVANPENVVIQLQKELGADGLTHMRGVKVDNAWNSAQTEETSLNLTVTNEKRAHKSVEVSYSIAGVSELLKSIIHSATHEDGNAQFGYSLNENFYIDGNMNINLSLGLGDLLKISVNLIAVSVTLDENGAIGFNVRLGIDGYSNALLGLLGSQIAVNGDTILDLTIKNGMIFMKRVQMSEIYESSPLIYKERTWAKSDWITLYRVMPASHFFSDMLNQIGFALNLNEKLINKIMDMASGSGGSDKVYDYGNYLTGYTHSDTQWILTLGGAALTNGILEDIAIEIDKTEDGCIRKLKITTGMFSVINAELTLNWRNPREVMEQGVEDVTQNVAQTFEGFGFNVSASDWGDRTYLELKEQTVSYQLRRLSGETQTVGSQVVLISTGKGYAAQNTLYSTLSYPDTESYVTEQEEYGAWSLAGENPVLTDFNIYKVGQIRKYDVTFRSPESLGEGWEREYGANGEETGYFVLKTQMDFGATVSFNSINSEFKPTPFVVKVQDNVFTLPEIPNYRDGSGEYAGKWAQNPTISQSGASFGVDYGISAVSYHSAIGYTYNGTTYEANVDWQCAFTESYTLITPVSAGYTFLGWYTKDGGTWERVTEFTPQEQASIYNVEALWISNLSAEIASKDQVRSGNIGNRKYTLNATAKITGGELFGAMAADTDYAVERTFDIKFTAYKQGLINKSDSITIDGGVPNVEGISTMNTHVDGNSRNRISVAVNIVNTVAGFTFPLSANSAEVEF